MDIHRCRFVPYPPQAINALAFSKPSDTQNLCPPDQRLAIGRADGDIEIWNPARGLWSQETIFRGGKDRSIEGLAWTQDLEGQDDEDDGQNDAGRLRLFSIGFSSVVTEWDLARGVPLRHANGNFGAIWCLAAQPRWTPRGGNEQHDSSRAVRHDQYLAAGCEDGTIVLFSTEDGDLRYLRTMGKPPTKKPRILSLTWKDRNTIVAGYSDSNIRVFDIRNRQTLRIMSLGKSATGGNETLVWAVKCLPNGTLVSGDSAGDLKIWDGNNYSLVQRLHCHEADILDVTTNANGSMIITGGADRRTVVYKTLPAEKGDGNCRWTQIMHRRFHKHDVKTLASFESQDLSLVVSGGLDTMPVVMPLRRWQREYHRTLSHLPQSPQVSSAPRARIFISWWERQVRIWRLSPYVQLSEAPETPNLHSENHILLAQLLLKGEENITSAQISEDGNYLAVATVSNIKVFRLRLSQNPSDGHISICTRKVETLPSLHRFGARLVAFSPDCRWLCSVRSDNEVVLVQIQDAPCGKTPRPIGKSMVKLKRSALKTSTDQKNVGLGDYLSTIKSLAFSADSRLMAVGDLSGRITTWVLEGRGQVSNGVANGIDKDHELALSESSTSSSEDDSADDEDDSPVIHSQRWRKNPADANLPHLDTPLLTISFRPSAYARPINKASADVGSHLTRRTPHPYAHDLPTGDDRLIAVTVEHKVVEFRVLQGALSEWSRRNPASYLPRQFQQVRERAMGCFWDVLNGHERLWLYGSTWTFMLDLARDLHLAKPVERVSEHGSQRPQQNSAQTRKRKREEFGAEMSRTRGSGAGGSVPLSESCVGVGSHLRKFKNSKPEESQMIRLEQTPYPASDDEQESGLGISDLAQLRREAARGGSEKPLVNGHGRYQVNGVQTSSHEASHCSPLEINRAQGPDSFLSLKYRSILGIVLVGGAAGEDFESRHEFGDKITPSRSGLEVAVIERPIWDVDLPPRFDGGQDWET
jgi:U3 small nucleolar RNA-associated protein 4